MNRNKNFRNKPLIGVTTRLNTDKNYFYLGKEYSEAIYAMGGIPYHLSLFWGNDYIREALSILDGVLLPGNDSDVDPLKYGSEPRQGIGAIMPERDETDWLVLEESDRLGLPILGICYGMQIINVFRGGTLIQDIAREVPASLSHQQGSPKERLSHKIQIAKGSYLESVSRTSQSLVNSHHHQAVDQVGKNLEVSARSSDGIIEAIEDVRPQKFLLGIQWHPELLYKTDKFARDLFSDFVRACSNYKAEAKALS